MYLTWLTYNIIGSALDADVCGHTIYNIYTKHLEENLEETFGTKRDHLSRATFVYNFD